MPAIDGWLEGFLQGPTTLWVVLVVSLLVGLRHASDPDHLADVTTLIASQEQERIRKATSLGLLWGLGHGTTLVLVGLPLVLLGQYLPERVAQAAEVAIGLIIVMLAVRPAREVAPRRLPRPRPQPYKRRDPPPPPLARGQPRMLKRIVALPEALGEHPYECGHPEMRRLPDGVFHCPACRSEVLPISIPKPTRQIAAARRWLAAFERIPGTSAGTPDEEGARRMASGGSANGG